MIIGVPKEIMPGERRVAASPETVAKMVGDGLTVLVEKNAGREPSTTIRTTWPRERK